jgi:diketogulonate reductase-like aldo/keto reductase
VLQKPLGSAGEHIPAIGLGTGVAGYAGRSPRYEALEPVVRAAIDLGMTLIDTAPGYGDGEAERRVGRAVQGMRQKVFLATKVSPNDVAKDDLVVSAEESMCRLGTDYLDLLQVHWSNPGVPIHDTVEGLSLLVERGKVRYVGVSNFSPRELEEARRAFAPGEIVSNQLEYNLFDRGVEDKVLPLFVEESLSQIAGEHGRSPAQVALNWIVQQGPVVAIPNTTNVERVREISESLDFTLSPEESQDIALRCTVRVRAVPVDEIKVEDTSGGPVYTTLQDAVENRHNAVPSPAQLAEQVREGEFLKPVRLLRRPEGGYTLVEGKIRYWAWVIAHDGVEPVAALIDEP